MDICPGVVASNSQGVSGLRYIMKPTDELHVAPSYPSSDGLVVYDTRSPGCRIRQRKDSATTKLLHINRYVVK